MEKAHKGLCGIYQFKNTQTDRKFIGASTSMANVFEKCINDLRMGNFKCEGLQREWNLYGPECFEYSVMELVDDKYDINNRARYWVNKIESTAIDDNADDCVTSGYVSLSRDVKDDLRALNLGTFDTTVRTLIAFYKRHSESEI